MRDEKELQPEIEKTTNGTGNENSSGSQTHIDVEVQDASATSAEAPKSIESLEQEVLAKESQIQDYIGRLQRLQADFDNYRKRMAREQEGVTKLIENRIYMKVLPIYDSFDRAVRIFERDQNKDVLAEGVKFIYSQFNDLLKNEGIQAAEVVGKPFDPMRHEALFMAEDDGPPNIVLEEFERGYQRGDQILRPSRVKVSKRREAPVQQNNTNVGTKTEPERGER